MRMIRGSELVCSNCLPNICFSLVVHQPTLEAVRSMHECEYMPQSFGLRDDLLYLVGMFSPHPSVFWNNNVQA